MGTLNKRKKNWIERTVANDRSYKIFLYNRLFILGILFLLQIAGYIWCLYLVVNDSAFGVALQLGLQILSVIAVLYLLNKYDRSSMTLGWILLILAAPIFGVAMYLACGEGRATKKMRKKLEFAKAENKLAFHAFFGEKTLPKREKRADGVSYYLANHADYPLYTQGGLSYYKSGEALFQAMLEELEKAEKFILLEYFIISHGKMWGEILKKLLEKAEQGVRVYILYDDFGCIVTLPPDYNRYLESLHSNIKCMTFNNIAPIFAVRFNNRDHRKIMVIDGKTAFTGGANLADEYIGEKKRFGYWKDAGVKITGNAVNSFTRMFFDLWNAFRKDKEDVRDFFTNNLLQEENAVRIQPYDDSPLDMVSVGETVYLDIINRASEYVYIFTPYLVLDDQMREALSLAALRGVDVRIVTPGIPDKKTVYRLTRANYPMLIKKGVKIYEYSPGFIHSKCVVADDECAVVGTINMDYRSLYHHFENAVYFADCAAVLDVKKDCEETFLLSKLCTESYPKRNLIGRLLDSLLRVFETLF